MSIAINPDWVTSTVRQLAACFYGSKDTSTQFWGGERWVPNPAFVPADPSVGPILADALQEAGCDNEGLLKGLRDNPGWMRNSQASYDFYRMAYDTPAEIVARWNEQRVWQARLAAHEALGLADAVLKRYDERIRAAEHYRRVKPLVDRLEARSKAAYAAREVGRGYWLGTYAGLLRTPGYVRVETHDLRGTPPAGTVWVRKSSSGKWGKSRRDKYGPPMTPAQVEGYVAGQAQAVQRIA